MRRGDVYWAELPGAAGRRPVVIVSRTDAVRVRSLVTVAPVTRTIRRLESEVPLGPDQGLRTRSVANCDSLRTVSKRRLKRRVGALDPGSLIRLDRALRYALGIRA